MHTVKGTLCKVRYGTKCSVSGNRILTLSSSLLKMTHQQILLSCEMDQVRCARYRVQYTLCKVQGTLCKVQGTMYTVQDSGYNVQGTWYNVHCARCRLQCTLCKVKGTIYAVQGTLCKVQGTLCNVQGTMYTVQGTGYNVKGIEWSVKGNLSPSFSLSDQWSGGTALTSLWSVDIKLSKLSDDQNVRWRNRQVPKLSDDQIVRRRWKQISPKMGVVCRSAPHSGRTLNFDKSKSVFKIWLKIVISTYRSDFYKLISLEIMVFTYITIYQNLYFCYFQIKFEPVDTLPPTHPHGLAGPKICLD